MTDAERQALGHFQREAKGLQFRLARLTAAATKVYMAAHWTPDRPVVGVPQMWEALRDAAGITPGNSPKVVGGLMSGGAG